MDRDRDRETDRPTDRPTDRQTDNLAAVDLESRYENFFVVAVFLVLFRVGIQVRDPVENTPRCEGMTKFLVGVTTLAIANKRNEMTRVQHKNN